jgi:phospholipid-translocating ATPase
LSLGRLLIAGATGETPSKRSKIEKETNFNVIANFGILMGLCLACAVATGVYGAKTGTSESIFEAGSQVGGSDAVDAVVTFA